MKSCLIRHKRDLLFAVAGAIAGLLLISSLTTLELKRTNCLGICPVYTLRVSATGLVQYHGEFALVKGDRLSYISPIEAWQIIWAALARGLLRFDNTYRKDDTDADGSYTCLSFGPLKKCVEIQASFGLPAAPPELKAVNQMIDEAANSVQWTGTNQERLDAYQRGILKP